MKFTICMYFTTYCQRVYKILIGYTTNLQEMIKLLPRHRIKGRTHVLYIYLPPIPSKEDDHYWHHNARKDVSQPTLKQNLNLFNPLSMTYGYYKSNATNPRYLSQL